MSTYKEEWIALLLNQKYDGWLIANDRNHIFINIPDNQDIENVLKEFIISVPELKKKIKSKPDKVGIFIGNSVDSKFYDLS